MGWMHRILFVVALALAGLPSTSAQAPARHALVIGNAAYVTPGWRLANPVNDATLIATRLRALGFQVTPVMNATKAQMEAAMNAFTARLRAGGPNAVGVFYYAGHGVEHDGANLLVPVDVTATTMDELRYQAPPMQFLLRDVARVGNAVNIIILDACRNLPLPSGARAGPAGGLADLDDVPTNVLIAYATRPGLTAPDNPGEGNSVFTRTLADALATRSGETAVNLFSEVQAAVYEATGFRQRPEFRSGLLRAPTWRFATASAGPGAANPELERLRRENEALRNASLTGRQNPETRPAPQPPVASPPAGDAQERISVIAATTGVIDDAAAGRYMDALQRKLEEKLRGASFAVTRVSAGEVTVSAPTDIAFVVGGAQLAPSAGAAVNSLATALLDYPHTTIDIVAHTDSSGAEAFNLEMSERRAAQVAQALETEGVQPVRIVATGAGEARPVADNSTAQGRARNRRVDIVLRVVSRESLRSARTR
ncbi:MAG: caspase family protein [Hyphomonadaceae bacterium]|nr:caspase family protein [Hyphomonadaceae bacterium]